MTMSTETAALSQRALCYMHTTVSAYPSVGPKDSWDILIGAKEFSRVHGALWTQGRKHSCLGSGVPDASDVGKCGEGEVIRS